MLLLIDTILLAVPALALSRLARPRGVAGGIAAFLIAGCALIVVVSEAVGRFVYTPASLTIAAAVLAVPGAVVLVVGGHGWRRWCSWNRRVRAVLAEWPTRIIAAVWALLVLYSIAAVLTLPPGIADVLRYHMPMVVGWLQDARVGVVQQLDYRANFFPHNVNLLDGWAFVLGGDRCSALPQVVLSGLLWPVVAYLAARGGGIRRPGAMLVALLASMAAPVALQMRNEMVDVGFYAAFILALLAALGRERFYGRPWLVAGIAAGFAVGAKSTGPLVAGICGIAWVVGAVRSGGWRPFAVRPRRLAGELVVAGVLVLAVGGWVYARNWIEHGNPVFPMGLKVGPFTFTTPTTLQPIYYNDWIRDFGESPATRLAGGMVRWPGLFLGLPPFQHARSAVAGGFGFVTTLSFAGLVILTVFLALRNRWHLLRAAVKDSTALLLVAVLLLWNVVFLCFVSLITAPNSLVDARYQLHWALVFPLLLVIVLRRFGARVRAMVLWVLAAVCVLTGYVWLEHAPERGFRTFRAVAWGGQDRLEVYGGRPFFVSGDPAGLLEMLGDSAVLVHNRGRVYPFYLPSFQRRVYPISPMGASMTVVDAADIPRQVHERSIENLRAWYARKIGHAGTPQRDRAVEKAALPQINFVHESLPYYEAMARRYDARFLYWLGGPHPELVRSPHWTLVLEDDGPPGRRMALFEFAGEMPADHP